MTTRLLPSLLGQMMYVAALVIGLAGASTMSPAAAQDRPVRIVAFGDSLTAGYRLAAEHAFPVRLARRLEAKGIKAQVVNAGVSGDTTATGLARFDWVMNENVDAVILELGANDALRGLDPRATRSNLEEIVLKLKARGVEVLLAGMHAPRSMGAEYTVAFDQIFPDLAKRHDLLLYPFFLEGVALNPQLNLDDGIHPTARGVDVIVDRILPYVERLIDRVKARAASK